MNRTQQLDYIEKLISYSGLAHGKARELLEKTNWNVDGAYRLYKSQQMEYQGFKKPPASVNRFSDVGPSQPPQRQGGVFARPTTEFYGQLGTATTGTGPAVGGSYLQGYRQPNPVPKFPVERPNERIIPIQVEIIPEAGQQERQQFKSVPNKQPPPTSVKPAMQNKPVNTPSAVIINKPGVQPPPGYQQPGVRPAGVYQSGVRPSGINPSSINPSSSMLNKAEIRPTVVANKPSIQPSNSMQNKPGINPSAVSIGGTTPGTPPFPRHSNIPSSNVQSQRDSKGESHDQPSPLPTIKQQPNKIELPANSAGSTSKSPKLKRGISKISQNAMLVDMERKNVLHDIEEDCHDNMYVQTFVLPDVTGYSDDFRAFLERDLIELSTLVSLEQAGRLNWWAEIGVCQRLLPMATSGDGNCLLHAASLAMWGIHDRQLMLRKALHDTLTKKYYRQALYRRWRWQQTQANKEAGLIFSEEEWQQEWENVLRLASSTPRLLPGSTQSNLQRKNSCCDSMVTQANTSSPIPEEPDSPVVYESLEEFHVFILAHVIQRPIIIVADTVLKDVSGDALAPIPFGGIYLPLECDASHCYRSPLLLTYDAAHFSALAPMDHSGEEEKNGLPVAIPIVSPDLEYLPLHFSIDPGINFNWDKNNADFKMSDESKLNLLKRYMDIERLSVCGGYLDSNSDDRNSTGSYESDDGLIDKSKKKDGKVSQQLHSVSKQFGSFGKSVGKKLKNLGKVNKEDKKGTRKFSMTQSTKRPLTISSLGDMEQTSIWCCNLLLKKSETHQKMIDNYLYDAGERFKKEVSARRLRNNEIVSRGQNSGNAVQQRSVPCVTSGCNLYGTVETSYLCTKCYADQKKQLVDQEKDLLKNYSNKHKPTESEDTTKVGTKSKFYDMKGEQNNSTVQPSHVDLNTQGKGHAPRVLTTRVSNPSQDPGRDRTPSPDYDNVDYPTRSSYPVPASKNSVLQTLHKSNPVSPKPQPKVTKNQDEKHVAQPCKNPNCSFFGSKDTEFFCSGCYKNKHKLDLKHV